MVRLVVELLLYYGACMRVFLLSFLIFSFSLIASSDPTTSAYEDLARAADRLVKAREEALNPEYIPVCPRAYHCGQLYVWGEYLSWRLHEDGLHFAVSGVETSIRGELYALDGNWESGFRVGCGYQFPGNFWEASLSWLCIKMSDSKSVTPPAGLELWATRSLPSGPDDLDLARGDFDGKINSIDFELAAPFYTRSCFSIAPYLGVRGDWIGKDFTIFYAGQGGGNVNFFDKLQMWGVGPQGGVKSNWYFTDNFSLFGKAGFAYLLGQFDEHQVSANSTGGGDSNNVDYEFFGTTPVLNYLLGIEYSGCQFMCLSLDFWLGWESTIWFDVARTFQYLDPTLEGNLVQEDYNLTASGLSFRLQVGF